MKISRIILAVVLAVSIIFLICLVVPRFGKNILCEKDSFYEKTESEPELETKLDETEADDAGAAEKEPEAEPEITLTRIKVHGEPFKKLYYVGDDFDRAGITVIASYSNGSSKTATGWTASGFSTEKISLGDKQTLTISYTEGDVTETAEVSGLFYIASKEAKPVNKPVLLSNDEYTGTFADGVYYKFGNFPQTISSLSGDESYTKDVVYNGYYLGADGYFYEKCKENPNEGGYKYSDGSPVDKASSNVEKYFRVEPIKWRVLNPSEGKEKILVAENVLMSNVAFYDYSNITRKLDDKAVYPNNYKHSKIRAYLNGLSYVVKEKESAEQTVNEVYLNKGFLQKAFTSRAQKLISLSVVENEPVSANPSSDENLWNEGKNMFACENTKDKIFLLSEKEVTAGTFGFAEYDDYGRGNSRIRKTTDYAKANFAHQSAGSAFGGWWWLRSPYYFRTDFALNCDDTGSAYDFDMVSTRRGGVVPALSISIED